MVGETIFIHVIDSTSREPIGNEPVRAGPASSATDIDATWGPYIDYTTNECTYEAPNGSAVNLHANGPMVVSNGTTTTLAACPLKSYDTNATGWVTISNQNASYFFIEASTRTPQLRTPYANAQCIAILGSQAYVTAPYPEGNFTVSSKG